MDGAEDAEVGSRTSSTTRLAKNLSASMDIAEDAKVGENDSGNNKMVKNHLFPKSQMDLQGILPLYIPKKDEFFLIVFGHYWSF